MLDKAKNNEFHTLDYYLWYPFPMVSKFHGYNVTSYHYWDNKEFYMIYNEKYEHSDKKKEGVSLNEFILEHLSEYAVIDTRFEFIINLIILFIILKSPFTGTFIVTSIIL